MTRIIITAGGTGGHLYPAIALGKELQNQNVEVLFLGQNLPKPGASISAGRISPKKPLQSLRSLGKILYGVCQSMSLLRKHRPDLVVGFGSIYTLPVLFSAFVLRVPIALHEQNCVPGKANCWMSRIAKMTAVTFPDAVKHLIGKTELVEMPLRDGYRAGTVSSEEARASYGLDPNCPTLFVFGGSQGARAINQLMLGALPKLPRGKMQVIHLVGKNDSVEAIERAYAKNGICACVKDYEERMDRAWQAADLMVSRAGAGTIAEQIAFEVPGILIPYPFAKDQHQDKNADFLQQVVKGGVKAVQSKITSDFLASEINRLMESANRKQMQEAMREYKKKNPRQTMAEVVMRTAHE